MTQITDGPSASALTRWTALIVIALGIGALLVYLQRASILALWSAPLTHADTLFAPRPGLAAMAVAAAALIVFCAAMLRPLRRRSKPYDRLSLLLAGFVLVAATHLIAIVRGWPIVSFALLGTAWILAGVMFVVAARAAPLHHSLWLRLPFSITFALVSLLLLEVLASATASPRLADLPPWLRREAAVVALGLLALVAVVVVAYYHDWIYPIALAVFVAALPLGGTTRTVALAMWTFSAGMLLLAILAAVLLARDPRERQPVRRRAREYATTIAPVKKGRKRRGHQPADADSRRYLLEADSSLMRL